MLSHLGKQLPRPTLGNCSHRRRRGADFLADQAELKNPCFLSGPVLPLFSKELSPVLGAAAPLWCFTVFANVNAPRCVPE